MSHNKALFFFGPENERLPAEDFVIRLPQGIQDKVGLLSHYAKAGQFPTYFGNNWDALNDCLRDFSWINKKNIIITHDDLPLLNDEKNLLVYLDILKDTLKHWKSSEQHTLLVMFPAKAEVIITRLLAKI